MYKFIIQSILVILNNLFFKKQLEQLKKKSNKERKMCLSFTV